MKNILLFFSIFVTINMVTAQDFNNNYTPLKSSGEIPPDILIKSTEKYENAKKTINSESDRNVRKDKDRFYLQSSFIIDELMKSGRILFNDPVSKYVNEVADKLLSKEPELRKKLKFYIVKSTTVNAFATDRGNIFINLGLLARLENEAQLAFILAHEVVHFKKSHNIQSFIEYAEIDRESSYRRSKSYDNLLNKNNYSQSLEREADDLGLSIFLASDYNWETLLEVFEILGTAHAPFINIPFSMRFLETPNIQFNSKFQLDSVNAIVPYEIDEDKSTHPSARKRKGKLMETLFEQEKTEKLKYLVSESRFKKAKKTAQFEICNLSIKYQNYIEGIYYTYALLQEYPNNQFLRITMSKALYGLAQYENADRIEEIIPYSYSNYQGEIQAVYYFFNKLSSKEINVLAAAYAWQIHQAFPDSRGLELMAKDMIEDVVIFQVEKPFEFFKTERASDLPVDDVSFERFGLGKAIENESVIAWLKDGKKYRKNFEADKAFYKTSKGRKKSIKTAKKKYAKGVSLGIDEVVFVNPSYMKIDIKKNVPYRFIETESTQATFKDMILENAELLNLKTRIIDINNYKKTIVDEDYHNLVLLNSWFEEYLSHDIYMVNSNYDEILEVAENLGTDYFSFAGAISYKGKNRKNTTIINFFYRFIDSKYECLHYNFVFDVRQNRVLLKDINLAQYKDKPSIIQQNLYWAMLQMKRASKKDKK